VFLESKDFSSFKPDPTIGAVLCGFDMFISMFTRYSPNKQFLRCPGVTVSFTGGLLTHTDYKKLGKAYSYLRDNEGCEFILTNQDATFPTDGTTYPGICS
jgi:4-nitrophenyl phosphatase